MKNLTIRNVSPGLYHELVTRAKANNRSMQGEMMTILQEALYPGPGVKPLTPSKAKP